MATSAVRDEGTSYHYLAPSNEVSAQSEPVQSIVNLLEEMEIPFETGKTWTTDGYFRETRNLIAKRRIQGCKIVEMEAAALFAVAQFRNVQLGHMVYAGDDVGGESWDRRGWKLTDTDVRAKVFELAIAACQRM